MQHGWRASVLASILIGTSVLIVSAADPGVTFIGQGVVAGSALDRSGLAGQQICQADDPETCIDQATLGGFGSGLTFTGYDDVFVAVPDRGPFDGRTDVPYLDRFHFLYMTVNVGAPFPNITTVLLDTRFLWNESHQHFVGDSSAIANDDLRTLRFDPEGVRVSSDGNFFVSDEYGPYLFKFNRQGHLIKRIPVPEKFLIANPTGEVDDEGNSLELYPDHNTFGRQANRGMEGLAITPDGRTIVGVMQNALIQDHGLNDDTPPGRKGTTTRIFTYDLQTGDSHEYVYVLDAVNQGRGVNEILAINDHEFLVLERDNRTRVPTPPNGANGPNLKRIYKIDLSKPGLTDVSDVDSLPATAAELGSIVPVTKTLFLDLLSSDYKVDATRTIKDVIAEKVEALAWGPDLPDGRHVLYVVSDNDLFPGLPTQIYAFAIDGSASGANISYQPQRLPGPMFPPGQVKKIVGKK
jgi:hypothetical protein